MTGFGTYVQEGIELVVGQTANIPVVLQLAGVVAGGDGHAPTRRSSRRPAPSNRRSSTSSRSAGLPNNGRNFLSFMQLTPGVTIVQGPDGDEISVNGQKGITNNISVDGADFNNPFFGEQRGGQRPAFTFNQDAVKELVVVADGAAPEFGRSGPGSCNVVTKSGTNDAGGTAHFFCKADALSSENAAGQREVPVRPAAVRRHARRPAAAGPAVLLPRLRPAAVQPDQATRPRAHRAARRGLLRSPWAARTRTGPSTAPTTPACSSARSTTR